MGISLCVMYSVFHGLIPLFTQQTGADQGFGHTIRVTVGGWAAVLKVTLLLLANATGNADAGTTVGHACGEFVDVGGFVVASETAGIVESPFGVIGTDVVMVPLSKLLDGLFNGSGKKANKQTRFKNHATMLYQAKLSFAFDTHFNPPSSLISFVLKFVWQPAPFQLPEIGLGSNEATTPKSSQTRCNRKRATQR